jgi:hypothetical protein
MDSSSSLEDESIKKNPAGAAILELALLEFVAYWDFSFAAIRFLAGWPKASPMVEDMVSSVDGIEAYSFLRNVPQQSSTFKFFYKIK